MNQMDESLSRVGDELRHRRRTGFSEQCLSEILLNRDLSTVALLRDAVSYFNRRADLAFCAFDHVPCQFGNLGGA